MKHVIMHETYIFLRCIFEDVLLIWRVFWEVSEAGVKTRILLQA